MPLTVDEMTPVDKALVDDNHKPTDAEKAGPIRKAYERFAALLGISVTGLFTHSFEETTTVLICMAFIGLTLKRAE